MLLYEGVVVDTVVVGMGILELEASTLTMVLLLDMTTELDDVDAVIDTGVLLWTAGTELLLSSKNTAAVGEVWALELYAPGLAAPLSLGSAGT